MYLFKRELKAGSKSLLIWLVVCSLIMTMSLSMFPSFAKQGAYITEVMASFPQEMLDAINASNIDFTNPMDYFGYIFQYVLLGAAIMAMLLGINILGKEEGDKTIEFLNAKPISRNQIVTEKLLAALVQLVVFSVLIAVLPYILLNLITDVEILFAPFIYVGLGVFLTQVICVSLGFILSTLVIKAKRSMPLALGVVFTLYFFSMMQGILKEDWMKYISPFSYFNVSQIVETSSLHVYGVLIALSLTVLMVTGTYLSYNKKDFSN